MKTKSFILYGARLKLTNAHKLVSHPDQPDYFVRMKASRHPFSEAIEHAKPMVGEVILNTVPALP